METLSMIHPYRPALASALFVLAAARASFAQAPAAGVPVTTSPVVAPPAQPERPTPVNQEPAASAVTETGEASPPLPANAPAAPVASAAAPEGSPAVEPVSAPPAAPAPSGPSPLRIGGGGILWYYQPTESGQKNNLEFYNIRLTFDATFGDGFAFHVEPRVRDSKLRSFFGGTAWIQEGYGSYTHGLHTFKLGKIYSQFGLFWDNSFWGNVQVYDGLKLAPDYGGSLEGKFELTKQFGIGYAAQFFLVDGSTNVSLPGRDTISIPSSRRRNEVVLRVDPYAKFAKDGLVRLGLSAQRLEADSPGIPESERDNLRYGADFKLTWGGLGVWGEAVHQKGQSVTDYPIAGTPASDSAPAIPGRASNNISYYEVGAEYTYGRVTARYNFSAARYGGLGVKEWLHVPALGLKLNDHLSLGGEYVHWSRTVGGSSEKLNRSLNVLLYVDF
jgi:hypothetical protein